MVNGGKPLSDHGERVLAELAAGMALIAAEVQPAFKDGGHEVTFRIPVTDRRDTTLCLSMKLERNGPAPLIWTP